MANENQSTSEVQPIPKWLPPAGFCIGIIALGIVLWVAVRVPTPTLFLFNIMRTLIALGGAAFSMSLSGLLVIRLNLPSKGYIVAGGTLAVFVVLYFFPPAGLQPTQLSHTPSASEVISK